MPEDDGGTESPSAPLLLPAPQPLPAAHSVGTTPFSSDVSLIETPTISGSDLLVGQSYHLRRHGCWNTSLRDQSHLCFPSLILSRDRLRASSSSPDSPCTRTVFKGTSMFHWRPKRKVHSLAKETVSRQSQARVDGTPTADHRTWLPHPSVESYGYQSKQIHADAFFLSSIPCVGIAHACPQTPGSSTRKTC